MSTSDDGQDFEKLIDFSDQAELIIQHGSDDAKTFHPLFDNASFGRHPDNDIVFDDFSISRQHATIVRKDSGFFIKDLDSTNGTFVNSQNIEGQERQLVHGDLIRFGGSKATISFQRVNTRTLKVSALDAAWRGGPDAEQKRIERELNVAKVVQQKLLPQNVPSFENWQLASYYEPAREVGGDFYDFLNLPDGRLGLVIGDVTDKGVPAALVMATTRSVVRALAEQQLSPGQVLRRANEMLCPDIPNNMFITCLYAVLDTVSGRIEYANAGHDLPYLKTNGDVVELRAIGMPLGLMPGMSYDENESTIAPGESILLYSDGLVEAHNPEREMFGFPRLGNLMKNHPGGAPLIDFLLDQLEEFTGADWEQEDDVTLVTVQRLSGNTAKAQAPSKKRHTLIF